MESKNTNWLFQSKEMSRAKNNHLNMESHYLRGNYQTIMLKNDAEYIGSKIIIVAEVHHYSI